MASDVVYAAVMVATRSGKYARTRLGINTLHTANPASAVSDPANSSGVEGPTSRSAWPPVMAASATTTTRSRRKRDARTGASSPKAANANGGNEVSAPPTVPESCRSVRISGSSDPTELTTGRRFNASTTIATTASTGRGRVSGGVTRPR